MLSRLIRAHRETAGGLGPNALVRGLTRNWNLIWRLTKREVAGRYRSSLFGLSWTLLTPLLMLAVYVFVFSVVFVPRWSMHADNRFAFGLIIFLGLTVFSVFAECLNRAPVLLLENPTYITKVVFPLETLPYVILLGALINAVVAFAIFLLAYPFVFGIPPWTMVLLPIILLPLLPFVTGCMWFLSSIGVYIRDVRYAVGLLVSALMFVSPIFYPISAVPAPVGRLMYLNPLTPLLEWSRGAVFDARLPPLDQWAILLAASLCFAWAGYVWFMLTKRGFADVL